MSSVVFRFLIRLVLALLIGFIIHLGVLYVIKKPLFENQIILAYVFNLLLAFFTFAILYLVRRKYKQQLGFMFMASSGLKFLLFFLIFYPTYHHDGTITKFEFLAFFIPYTISMILEISALSKLFNKLQ